VTAAVVEQGQDGSGRDEVQREAALAEQSGQRTGEGRLPRHRPRCREDPGESERERYGNRIVAARSFRAAHPALLAQTRPGGRILLTLSGWLYGYARVLLTVAEDGTAEGQLLGGTVSFMSASTHAAPVFGNPAHWAAGLPDKSRTARHSPEQISAATKEAFRLRFLAQSAVADAQMTTVGEVVHLVDVVTGSAATLTPGDGTLRVREGGRVKLWERIERVLDAYDAAGRPGPETFTLHVYDGSQHLRHKQMPGLPLPGP
jgi:hypothetical protein